MQKASKPDWAVVADALDSFASKPTAKQLVAGRALGLQLNSDTPEAVAAVLLQREVADSLPSRRPRLRSEATEGDVSYLHELEDELEISHSEFAPGDDAAIVLAWVRVRWAQRSARDLRTLKVEKGDVLNVRQGRELLPGIVSSISVDGAINFKGGRRLSARTHDVQVRAHKGDPGYEAAKAEASNVAARRAPARTHIGSERQSELAEFRVDAEVDEVAYEAYLDALGDASDERPMQTVLANFPQLLSPLVPHHNGLYVIPQKRLGAEFVPDFVVGGYTSAGMKWVLVELESPAVELYLKNKKKNEPGKELRKGISQIEEWREWLKPNLDYARRTRKENGLGLPGIRDDIQGVVIIGRGEPTDDVDSFRQRIRNERDIEVITYNWIDRENTIVPGDPEWLARFLL